MKCIKLMRYLTRVVFKRLDNFRVDGGKSDSHFVFSSLCETFNGVFLF